MFKALPAVAIVTALAAAGGAQHYCVDGICYETPEVNTHWVSYEAPAVQQSASSHGGQVMSGSHGGQAMSSHGGYTASSHGGYTASTNRWGRPRLFTRQWRRARLFRRW